jgi:ribosomal small subunit protein bTHX
MGKGDKKTRRGKIILGTYGVRRRKKPGKIELVKASADSDVKKTKAAASSKEAGETKEVRHTRVKETKEEKTNKAAAKATEPKPSSGKKVIDEKKAANGEPAEAKPVRSKKA